MVAPLKSRCLSILLLNLILIQLTAACTDNAQLKADLDRERTCSQQEIRNLEQKLRQLHEQMMSKMKECSQARDQQVSLNTEIGNYKMLIDAADQKYVNF